ncbi:hypothetical protein [Erythrobacter sp. HKB08]|uniref:hypothetical protein n=1 Tax=Erythrobacter sp. HKB08 TaxID=2502843 RepID=UPI0010089C9C|nr:hypothetical protein [Erythrobacter sp. HKB08]
MAERDTLDPVVDATARTTRSVDEVEDLLWRLELAAHSAMGPAGTGDDDAAGGGLLTQIAASIIALATLLWLLARHGGTSPGKARRLLERGATVFAAHAEDSTRTRHLRRALAEYEVAEKEVLLVGRPAAGVEAAARNFDPDGQLQGALYIRPVTLGAAIGALPQAISLLTRGLRETRGYRGRIAFRDRIGMAFRMALGTAHARWWHQAASGLPTERAIFAHTGNADTSQLEQAMQASGIRTIHAVHGTNIGWAFAGLSDVAQFPSGADAALGEKLPAYGRCMHIPIERPAVSQGNGDWALLTSYTHLQHPAFAEHGSRLDCRLVKWVADAAKAAGQDPSRIFWRPHPQIDIVPGSERERLQEAVAKAGFTRWPADLPYEALAEFSAAITTPSTVMTDGLRLGQPVIVASLSPLQSDLLYARYPLLVESEEALASAIARLTGASRGEAFDEAWSAIEPGARLQIARLLELV